MYFGKVIFTFITLMFVSNCSISQSIYWGPEAGMNFSNITESPSSGVTSDSKTGLVAGLIFETKYESNFSNIFGIRYITKGYNIKNGQADVSLNLEYLDFPAFVKYNFNIENINPYIVAGVAFGLNLSAKLKASQDLAAAEVDVKKSIEVLNYDLLFGAGIDINILESKKLFVQIAYSLGLSDINKSRTSWRNTGIQVTTGILFSL